MVLPDSSTVDLRKLDPEVPHLQITSVSPYFDHSSTVSTPFEHLYNLNRLFFIILPL